MVSIATRVIEQMVRVLGLKRRLARVAAAAGDPDELGRLVKSLRRWDRLEPPRRSLRSWTHERVDIDRGTLHLLSKPDGQRRRVITYLHGGGYMFGPGITEWRVAESTAKSAGCDLAMFVYPKAPEHEARHTVAATVHAFEAIGERYGAENVVAMGTSAGGGLAVATMAELRDRGSPQPALAVLISPGVDLAIEDDVSRLEKTDVLLSVDFVTGAGSLYAGDLGLRHSLVSPVYGDLGGLAPMHVLAGTKEILFPGLETFVERVNDSGGEAHLVVGEGQQHGWPTAPTPEGRSAVRRIVEIVRKVDPEG